MFLFYVLSFFKKGDTIQGGTLFKGGHYLRKYGIYLNVECTCNVDGTIGTSNTCDKVNGRCNIAPGCKNQYAGDRCSLCNSELDYYGVFPNCKGW